MLRSLRTTLRSALDTAALQRSRLTQSALLMLARVASWYVPVVPVPRRRQVYVLGRDAVRSVMERPAEFSVAASGARMRESIGAFFLGMDPGSGSTYECEAGAMRRALGVPDPAPGAPRPPRDDAVWARLRETQAIAREHARDCVKQALLTKGEIDVVNDLADVVPLRFVHAFFGVPEPKDGGHLLAWFRAASFYVFSIDAPEWKQAAANAGRELTAHMSRVVDDRRDAIASGRPGPDDVLARLLVAERNGEIDGAAIVRCLNGTLSGTIIPTSWLFVKAFDRLLRRPRRERERLHRYAVEGDAWRMRAYVLEAARFFPFPAYLLRDCVRDARIGSRLVAKGTRVVLVPATAAFDRRALRRPLSFVPGRPESDSMLFGHAAHLCMGKDIAEAMMTEMAMALFAQRGLRRVRGLRGLLDDRRDPSRIPDGPYPRRLVLEASGWSS